ncbi:MAG: methyltransferase domain-containing protein [Candidatus Omnitrophica bacterium]|nr:methyltransferase domain-containing protein [Candidatus Omnitrophota bacterium]MDD5237696.1 methyltransferase domain-containing protein [Candidatus Omnitrophota bacterium]
MDKQLLKRNECIVWYNRPQDGVIFTCLKEKKDFISLRGIQARLWTQLSKACSIGELRGLIRKNKTHMKYSHKIENIIKPLIRKGILEYHISQRDKKNPAFPQKYQKYNEFYLNLSRELNSVKNFNKNPNLNLYHKNSIHGSHRHFEKNEVTVSHVYREAHPALGGMSYGARLFRKLNSIKKINPQSTVVEVGGGTGFLTRSFLEEYKRNNHTKDLPRYACCDLSFKFLENQRDANERHHLSYCQANAECMPFKNNSLDLIIANENIADFTAAKVNKKEALDFLGGKIELSAIKDPSVRRSLYWIKFASLDINDATPEFIFNLGAVEFISRVKKILKRGGLVFITEYGIMNGYPTAVYLRGHVEYSIQFNHLIRVAKALGMRVEIHNLAEFFGFKKNIAVIDHCSLGFLYNMLKKDKIDLPFLAYTKEMLRQKIPKQVRYFNNLKFVELTQKSVCHNLNKFHVLLIFKGGET